MGQYAGAMVYQPRAIVSINQHSPTANFPKLVEIDFTHSKAG